jgi:hypothetical protein
MNKHCHICSDVGWVCEKHSETPWSGELPAAEVVLECPA